LNQSFSGDGEPFVGRQVCELSEDVEREYFFGRTKMRRVVHSVIGVFFEDLVFFQNEIFFIIRFWWLFSHLTQDILDVDPGDQEDIRIEFLGLDYLAQISLVDSLLDPHIVSLFELHFFLLPYLEQTWIELVIHRNYPPWVYIDKSLKRLLYRFLVLGLDEDLPRVFLFQGHRSANLHLELLVLGLLVVGRFVEDRHYHLLLFALLAADVEHLEITSGGKHRLVLSSFVDLLLI
jgi:hypothetical protein